MTTSILTLCRRGLATQLATLLFVSPPAAIAASIWTVNTCDEGTFGNPGAHTGTLRFAASMAASGDTIDLTQLSCSTISLKSGAIALAQDDITLNGPGIDALTITGKYGPLDVEHDRIIRHSGSGWLKLNDLTLSYGLLDENAYDSDGGCIRSHGNVALNNVLASRCRTYAPNGDGGAIRTDGALWLLNSDISYNIAGLYGSYAVAHGGGAYVIGDLLVINSTISRNTVRAAGEGGGIRVKGAASIYYSTISGNSAHFDGGGISAEANLTISNSTVSGNYAYDGGALEARGDIDISSSTIAFNSGHWIAGVELRPYQPMNVTLQSSLIASNTYIDNGVVKENDLDSCCAAAQATVTFSGTHNLIRTLGSGISLPVGVATTGVCPLLSPLKNNGGSTLTHALLSKSPGIDEGDGGTFIYDQRGFLRTSGSAADVGAYEIDQYDIIFNNAFDGCP